MRLQRVGDAESPIEMQFIKWTTEGIVKSAGLGGLVFYDVKTYVSCQEYVGIL